MSTPRISYQVENGIAQVKLSRAEKHNALDMPMFYAIENTIKQIKKGCFTSSVASPGGIKCTTCLGYKAGFINL